MNPKNNMPAIRLDTLKKSFGIGETETYVLNGINLTVERGEFIAIMGPSGCGKTTLLNILGLLDQSIEGEYELNGKSVSDISVRKQARIRSREIGYVFQNFNLISRLSIIENVALPLIYKGIRHTKRMNKASDVLKNFHLNEREYYMPHQLSGGQVQRVAIARALVNDPTIILADEPTGNLDSRSSDVIMDELSNLHKRGNTIIMVTHNPALTSYASRVITMLDGQIDTDTSHKIEVASDKSEESDIELRHDTVMAEDISGIEEESMSEAISEMEPNETLVIISDNPETENIDTNQKMADVDTNINEEPIIEDFKIEINPAAVVENIKVNETEDKTKLEETTDASKSRNDTKLPKKHKPNPKHSHKKKKKKNKHKHKSSKPKSKRIKK